MMGGILIFMTMLKTAGYFASAAVMVPLLRPLALSIQFNAILFVFVAVLHENTPNPGCPELGVHITEAGALLFHGLFYHYFTTTLFTVILVFIYWYLPLPAKPNITKNPHERWIFQHSRGF